MQTGDPRQLSRLRQGVRDSHEESGRLLSTLLEREPMVRGTVYELRRKCGKPGCSCATGEPHASLALTWSEEGRTRIRTVPPDRAEQLRLLTERYRRFRKARARLVKLQKQMMERIDRLETARRQEP